MLRRLGASLPGDNGYAFVLVHDESRRNVDSFGGSRLTFGAHTTTDRSR